MTSIKLDDHVSTAQLYDLNDSLLPEDDLLKKDTLCRSDVRLVIG